MTTIPVTDYGLPEGYTHVYSGKVRDLWTMPNGNLLVVATDRISAFDRILATRFGGKAVIYIGPLKPGRYTLQVRASAHAAAWGGSMTSTPASRRSACTRSHPPDSRPASRAASRLPPSSLLPWLDLQGLRRGRACP